jgi:hypothetical protein
MNFRTLSVNTTLVLALSVSACALPGRGDGREGGGGATTGPSSGSFVNATSTGSGDGGASQDTTTTSTLVGPATSTGSNTTAPTSTTTGGGTCATTTLSFTDQVCGGCAEDACCYELQGCDGSFECLDFLACLQGCTTTTCEDACFSDYPTGSSEFLALDDCMATSCAVECGF